MSNEAENVNINIPAGQAPQQEPSQAAQPQPARPAPPTTQIHSKHQTKMTFLLGMTVVLGVLSIVSLFFALRMRGGLLTTPPTSEEQPEPVTHVEEPLPTVIDPTVLDPEAEVMEIDKLELELIEETYTESVLEK